MPEVQNVSEEEVCLTLSLHSRLECEISFERVVLGRLIN